MLLAYAGVDPHYNIDNDNDDEKKETPATSTPSREMMLPVLPRRDNRTIQHIVLFV